MSTREPLLHELERCIAEGNCRPTNNELSSRLDVSVVCVDRCIRQLAEAGLIQRRRVGRWREITIVEAYL